jgi:hypothetical protein
VGSNSHVHSYQAMSVIASQGLEAGRAYPVTGAPGGVTGHPGPSLVEVGEGKGGQVVKSCLSTLDHGWVR